VRWILSHQAGLVAVDAELSVDDLLEGSPVVEALELQPPLWPPGTGHGYHSLTLGYLLGELVRRVDGRTIGEMFRDEVAGPLDLDFWIGLPNSEEHRVSRLVAPSAPAPTGTSDPTPEQVALAEALQDPDSLTRRALGMSAGIDFDDPHVHAAELASANGICDARSLARMYAATIGEVDGVRVLSPAMVRAAASTEAEGLDKVMFRHNRFGLGFLLKSPSLALPTEGAFGHTGSGGSLGFADPTLGIGFGYVMNQMQHPRGPDPRFNGLIDAARSALTSGGD
jgi:CubicO group peptidase (beta-lactamase class C family)